MQVFQPPVRLRQMLRLRYDCRPTFLDLPPSPVITLCRPKPYLGVSVDRAGPASVVQPCKIGNGLLSIGHGTPFNTRREADMADAKGNGLALVH